MSQAITWRNVIPADAAGAGKQSVADLAKLIVYTSRSYSSFHFKSKVPKHKTVSLFKYLQTVDTVGQC